MSQNLVIYNRIELLIHLVICAMNNLIMNAVTTSIGYDRRYYQKLLQYDTEYYSFNTVQYDAIALIIGMLIT